MSDRQGEIHAFLARAGWGDAKYTPLAGDASYRRYARLAGPRGNAILMDAPIGGDQRKTAPEAAAYNAAAHLAVSCDPFVAIGAFLRECGLTAPEVFASDLDAGLLLLQDFGDYLYFDLVGSGVEETPLYEAAVDVLLALHRHAVPAELPVDGAGTYALPHYDAGALEAEVGLLPDWYLPASGCELNAVTREQYFSLWRDLFPALTDGYQVLVLRDFHAQNLFWLSGREGVRRVGLIDYQDGLLGSPAYDLVSLLQDARRDVPPDLAAAMLARYCKGAYAADSGFSGFDEARFRTAYAIAGAQRNSRLLGTFTRLARRDGKELYLSFIPRVRNYLARVLSDPALAEMRAWINAHLPPVGG